MDKQVYQYIRDLAWDVLMDAQISQLPVNISKIASLYHLENLVDSSANLYANTCLISKEILKMFGFLDPDLPPYLAVRILAPMIVLKELNVRSAIQRFKRLTVLLSRNAFESSHLETKVLNQFQNWIACTRKHQGEL